MTKKKEAPVAADAQQEKTVKEIISEMLMKTGRVGVEDLLGQMDKIGFFTAPASTAVGRHNAEEGGLAQHSLNVMQTAEKIGVALLGGAEYNAIQNSVILVTLLHDLGKCGDFGKQLYVPNMIKDGKPTKAEPEQKYKQSDAKPWKRNPNLTNIPHSARSVIIAERWLDLTEDEEYAIFYHDGLYDRETGGMAVIPGHETQLLMILHWADMWCSRIIEGSTESEGE